jgi:hemoglobin
MNPTAFAMLGGEHGVRVLVDRFYDIMEADPRATGIRALHPADLARSRERLYEFLCGWLGGPPHYERKYGHPRLRARHLPFAIGIGERDQWLYCMVRALEDLGVDADLRERLTAAFLRTADFMRNREENGAATAGPDRA